MNRQMPRQVSRIVELVGLAVLIAASSGCYHYHLRAKADRANSSYFRKTLGVPEPGRSMDIVVPPSLGGGQGGAGPQSSADCRDNGLYEVAITSYWKDAFGEVFSFGRRKRVRVEWLCAKEPPVIGPGGSGARVESGRTGASPAEAGRQAGRSKQSDVTKKQDDVTKRTVHAFLWGALQQNLLPPAPSADSKTPANCRSMREVKLPMRYGHALITVLTAGIWSPMRVAWQCSPEPTARSEALPPAMTRRIPPLFAERLRLWPQDSSTGFNIDPAKEELHVPR